MASSRREPSPRAREIAAVALEALEAEGPDGLSMRRLADRLRIKAPSIYKHFPNKKALEAAVISIGFEQSAEAFEAAVAGADDPLGAFARSYRAFALSRPHLYRLMTEHELDRDLLTPGVEERAGRPILEAVGGDRNRARAAWAFAHGMTILELDRRFPADAELDAAWKQGIDAFRAGAAR